MTTQKYNPSAVGLAVGLFLSGLSAHALADDGSSNPLTLSLSESITHDSNVTRTTDPRSDESSQTDLSLKLDKLYGRQTYSASGRYGIARYKDNKQYDNNNYDLTGAVASEFGSNWSASIDGTASQNLVSNSSGTASSRLQKNLLKTNDAGFSLRYGVAGRWSVIGSLGVNRLSYSSDLQSYQNREQNSQGLRLMYSPSDLLNFSFGGSRAESKYPNLFVLSASGGEEVTQQSLDLGTNWQVTGFSNLSAAISFSNNKYKSDSNADYNAVTSRINWNFTPRGAVTYNLGFTRSTDSDGSQTSARTGGTALTYVMADTTSFFYNLPVNTVLNNVTTALNGSARWAVTSKVGLTMSAALYHFDVKRNLILQQDADVVARSQVVDASLSSSSNFTQFSLVGDYQFSRSIAFNCNLQKYKQTTDITRIAYDGSSVGCSASFTIN